MNGGAEVNGGVAANGGVAVKRRMGVVLAAVAALVLSACGGPAAPSEGAGEADGTVTLSFQSYNYGTPDLGGEGTRELIESFERTHPGIRIEPRGVATKDTLTALRTSVAGGRPVDVAQVGWSKMAEAYSSLPVVPVQSIPSPQEWDAAVAGMNPAIMRATARDGETVAMPFTMSIPTLFYNEELFRRAGLDPDKPPATMDELRATALTLKERTGAQGVYIGAANAGKSDFLTQSLIAGNGGSVVAPDGRITLDEPAAVEALAVLGDLTRSGAQPAVSEEDALAAFKGGNLGMLVTSTAVLAGLDAAASGTFAVRTAALPGYGARPAAPTYSGAGLVVLSQDPAKQRAAWEFVQHMTSPEAFTVITEKIGYLPLRPGIVDDPRYLGEYLGRDPRLRPALAQLDSVTPYRSFPGPKANQAVVMLQDKAVAPIQLQGADPGPTLTATAEAIRGLTAP